MRERRRGSTRRSRAAAARVRSTSRTTAFSSGAGARRRGGRQRQTQRRVIPAVQPAESWRCAAGRDQVGAAGEAARSTNAQYGSHTRCAGAPDPGQPPRPAGDEPGRAREQAGHRHAGPWRRHRPADAPGHQVRERVAIARRQDDPAAQAACRPAITRRITAAERSAIPDMSAMPASPTEELATDRLQERRDSQASSGVGASEMSQCCFRELGTALRSGPTQSRFRLEPARLGVRREV